MRLNCKIFPLIKKSWKFFNLNNDLKKIILNNKNKSIIIFKKNNIIISFFFSLSIYVYNGLYFKKFFILNFFNLYKLGIFFTTKKYFFFKKK